MSDPHTTTPAQLAEQAGYVAMRSALEAMRRAPTQAKRLELVHEALIDLVGSQYPDATAGGYAVALLCLLEIGLGVHQ